MHCTVFRSEKKDYTYLFLAEGTEFGDLPESLRRQFGWPVQIMQLDLAAQQKLANADIATVKEQLQETGYYLQLPPETAIEAELDARFR